ncbi:Z1 domain-containing protein, partial [Vibrio mediterranei]|uniref:Z1 domain-containing protein n=1 Tax=Vibrio mediterranei TaxID=689 RepID=UPI001EFC2F67
SSTVPEGFLNNFVQNESAICSLLDSSIKEKLIRKLEEYFWTENSNGHTLNTDFESWYPSRRLESDFQSYYWKRLEKYWYDFTVLPKEAIRATNEVTDEIMDYIGDPKNLDNWCRRGLVMGHVQSGKTTNYSALIAKAADAGYRIIVVLAGGTNALRKQTQERLDMTIVGKSSLGDDVNNEFYPISRVLSGLGGSEFRAPFCGTTQMKDFSVDTSRAIGAQEGNFAEPVLFVTKKHTGVLSRLTTWLSSLKENGPLEGPMLVIDDEADNATVNTSDSEVSVTRTNECIRKLLKCSKRSTYVGYTATPFANIFIHPDSNNDMLGDDLFPEHFIKSLEPPTNYIGAKDLFSETGRLSSRCIREIPSDYQDILPLNHRSYTIIAELPRSLIEAVYEYVLFRAIRNLDGEHQKHSSMMINVSRFNNIQKQVVDLVEDLTREIEEHVGAWSKSDNWHLSKTLNGIYQVWLCEYEGCCEYSWEDIRMVLMPSISSIEVSMVNMRGKALDYSSRKNNPLHVIAVGGLALARGLTLEGLAISYVLRNVGAGDTLLQLGRWFGYRMGYEHLCRIHLTEEMFGHFEHISESVEELRDDLVRMEMLKKAPDEFGLKVRESPTGISLTAANKMRSAEPVLLAADYDSKHIQGYEVYDNEAVNEENLNVANGIYKRLMDDYGEHYADRDGALVWNNVSSKLICELLRKFDLPQLEFLHMNDGESLLSNYIKDRALSEPTGDELWNIAIPYAKKSLGKYGERIHLPFKLKDGETVFCRQRYNGVSSQKKGVLKVTEKDVLTDFPFTDLVWGEDVDAIRDSVSMLKEKDSKIKNTKGILYSRKQPLLIIHLFQFALKEEKTSNLAIDKPTVSLSLGLTSSEFKPKERRYAATVRLIEQLNEVVMDIEDEDMVIDDD